MHQYLRHHPQICMADTKELNFFVETRNWGQGLRWYRRHFRPARMEVAIGEASPQYAMAHCFPGVPERIRSVLPDAKVVYLVRDPIERMQSHYLHEVANGKQTRPLAEAMREGFGYIATSRYGFQLDAYLEHFDAARIHVVDATRLRQDREATVRGVLAFVGVDPGYVPANLKRMAHTTDSKGVDTSGAALSAVDRRLLAELFQPEVAALRRWLGPEFDGWGLLGDSR